MRDRQRHHAVVVRAALGFALQVFFPPHECQHLEQRVAVVHRAHALTQNADELRQDHRSRQPVRLEAEGVLDLSCEVVLHLAHVQVAVAHQVKQLRRVRREVRLDGEQRVVIVLAEAVHLPRIRVLVVLVAQRADLLARDVVEHLPTK